MDRSTFTGQTFADMARAMYDDRCAIRRKVSSKVGLDTSVTIETLATDVPIRIKPSSAQEKEIAGATQGSTAFTVRIPAWQSGSVIPLDSRCLLDISARGEVEAHTLNVVAPLPSSGTKIDAVAVRTT